MGTNKISRATIKFGLILTWLFLMAISLGVGLVFAIGEITVIKTIDHDLMGQLIVTLFLFADIGYLVICIRGVSKLVGSAWKEITCQKLLL